jgi:arginyl-tRNA synthetase
VKNQIRALLHKTIRLLAKQEKWRGLDDFYPELEKPKQRTHGDFSSNVAMVLSGRLKRNPRELAQLLVQAIQDDDNLLQGSSIAGPGFINFKVNSHAWYTVLPEIENLASLRPVLGQGKKILIEYVSANPTGPLHIGNARGGPLGDVLARLLVRCGYEVTTEFYLNDIGGQIDRLGQSLLHWLKIEKDQASEVPEGAYCGDYIKEMAHDSSAHDIDYLAMDDAEASRLLATWGMEVLIREIRQDCEKMRCSFDRWVSEKDLRSELASLMQRLDDAGVTCEKDGALWFIPPEGATIEGGRSGEQVSAVDARESVLRKSDGEPTYFADDLICHENRYREGFDKIINIWGANHHGHVPRVKAALEALGHDPNSLEVVLYQYVRVCRGAEAVKMSKRAGDYVLAREVLDEVGVDATRFFLLMRAPSAHLDFDLELAKSESQENPIYYIQYAHARICSIQRKAIERGLAKEGSSDNLQHLCLPEELEMIQLLLEYPEIIERAATERAPQHMAHYLLEVARYFHTYYTRAKSDPSYRVLADDIDTSLAKLYLLRSIKAVLADGLDILNIGAPDEMKNDSIS